MNTNDRCGKDDRIWGNDVAIAEKWHKAMNVELEAIPAIPENYDKRNAIIERCISDRNAELGLESLALALESLPARPLVQRLSLSRWFYLFP